MQLAAFSKRKNKEKHYLCAQIEFTLHRTMKNKSFLCTLALLTCCTTLFAVTPLWLRSSAISPDGKTIAFTYKGDIYLVDAQGGKAHQLTSNAAYEANPVWSPSGKKLAFVSDREGSLDIFTISNEGEALTRITTSPSSEMPLLWLNEDEIVFRAAGISTPQNMQFPSNLYTHLYKIGIKAGLRPEKFSDISVGNLTQTQPNVFVYDAVKGYENEFRKHHTSSVTRDLWSIDLNKANPTYASVKTGKCEYRNPVFATNTKTLYYLSEEDGTFNIYNNEGKQLTHYKNIPVRYLTTSNDGVLCFSWDGELYTLQPGKQAKKVKIDLIADNNEKELKRHSTTSDAEDNVCISPKNKEIAFILNGDVYVTSLDYATTRQVTNTPGQEERDVTFSEDGKSIVYASERMGIWSLYRTTIVNEEEKQFTYATELKEELLTDGKTTCQMPQYSPDGKKIAFYRNRTELCVMDAKTKDIVTVMPGKFAYSYRDGDQFFCWNPNSKYLLVEYIGIGGWNNPDVALVQADGKGEIVNITNSGYSEGMPRWALDGKAILFQSDRAGYRSHGSWGSEEDWYITFLTHDSYERFKMNKEERELADAREKAEKDKAKKEKEKSDKEEKDKAKEKDKEKVEKAQKERDEKEAKADSIKKATPDFDFNDLEMRTVRLTTLSSKMGDAVLNKEGTKLYYVASYALGTALWEKDLEKGSNNVKSSGVGFSYFNLDKEGKKAYYIQGGNIKELNIEGGSVKSIDFSTLYTEQPQAEREGWYEHIWHQTKEKLYDPKMNGADWEKLYTTYKKFLPHLSGSRDFAEMASELLGELNVSHTGCMYRGGSSAMSVADLGAFFDDTYKDNGLRILEIISGTPLSLQKDIKPGCIITHIDGEEIQAGKDYNPLLEGKVNRYTRLTIKDEKGTSKDITLRLKGYDGDLLYRRWVKRNEHLVDSLSKGRLAYVHIESMNAESFHTLYRELLSDKNRNRNAVIVDVRHNGGGWLHNDVCNLLSGVAAMKYQPRGQYISTDPYNQWTKPSCMLICEDDYSNAHGTPWLYKELGVGKLIGAPVPGTMTAVWWEYIDNIVFGIPEVGALDPRGKYLENQLLEPDILIYSKSEDLLHGRDLQLECAVEEMLKK